MGARAEFFDATAGGGGAQEEGFVQRLHQGALTGLIDPTNQGQLTAKAQLQIQVLADPLQAAGEQVHGSGPRAAVQFGQGQLEEFAAFLDQCALLQFALEALGNVGDQRVAGPLAEGPEFAGVWSLGAATPALQSQELGLEALQQGVVAAMALEAQAAALLE